jgi:hypothetical protein
MSLTKGNQLVHNQPSNQSFIDELNQRKTKKTFYNQKKNHEENILTCPWNPRNKTHNARSASKL